MTTKEELDGLKAAALRAKTQKDEAHVRNKDVNSGVALDMHPGGGAFLQGGPSIEDYDKFSEQYAKFVSRPIEGYDVQQMPPDYEMKPDSVAIPSNEGGPAVPSEMGTMDLGGGSTIKGKMPPPGQQRGGFMISPGSGPNGEQTVKDYLKTLSPEEKMGFMMAFYDKFEQGNAQNHLIETARKEEQIKMLNTEESTWMGQAEAILDKVAGTFVDDKNKNIHPVVYNVDKDNRRIGINMPQSLLNISYYLKSGKTIKGIEDIGEPLTKAREASKKKNLITTDLTGASIGENPIYSILDILVNAQKKVPIKTGGRKSPRELKYIEEQKKLIRGPDMNRASRRADMIRNNKKVNRMLGEDSGILNYAEAVTNNLDAPLTLDEALARKFSKK